MAQRFIVTYDVCEAKRLRQVFKVLKGYGEHLQYSVFRCDLERADLARLKMDLLACLNCNEDQVLFIDIGPAAGRGREAVTSLGLSRPEEDDGAIVA